MNYSSDLHRPRSHTAAFIALRGVAGALLLAAAVLKAHQLLTGPALGAYWWDARPWQALAISGEVLLAGWMWSGLVPSITRRLGASIFGIFGAIALVKAMGGEASCGCFGRVAVNPWVTLALDVGLCVAFILIRPKQAQPGEVSGAGRLNRWGRERWVPSAAVALAGVVGAGLGLWTMNAEPARLQAETGAFIGEGGAYSNPNNGSGTLFRC